MSASAVFRQRYSGREYDELEDRGAYDLVDRQLVERHVSYISSAVAMVFARILGAFAEQTGSGTIFGPDLGIRIHPSDPLHTRRADVGFISQERAPDDDTGYLRVAPELVVEVVSPGDLSAEGRAKVDEWLEHGVRMVWVAFPRSREIHVYAAGRHPEIRTAEDELTGSEALPGCSASVGAFFPKGRPAR